MTAYTEMTKKQLDEIGLDFDQPDKRNDFIKKTRQDAQVQTDLDLQASHALAVSLAVQVDLDVDAHAIACTYYRTTRNDEERLSAHQQAHRIGVHLRAKYEIEASILGNEIARRAANQVAAGEDPFTTE